MNDQCYTAWEARVASTVLSRVCFMTPTELNPVASSCVDAILRAFPNLPPRYQQNYILSKNSQRAPMLSIVLFTMHLLPTCSPFQISPEASARLNEHCSNKLTGVYTSLEEFVDAVTTSSIFNPV